MSVDLTTGPVAGHLRRQATPMALGLVAIISFDAVDLFFVSRLGDAPLAAISFTFPIIWFLSSIIIGFEAGAASCISRAIGILDNLSLHVLMLLVLLAVAPEKDQTLVTDCVACGIELCEGTSPRPDIVKLQQLWENILLRTGAFLCTPKEVL